MEMATKKKVEQKRRGWTPAEDNYLEKLYQKGLRVGAIRSALNQRFQGRRKDSGIEGRLEHLGLRSRARKANGATPVRRSRQHKEMSLDLGADGRIQVVLEGKLSLNGSIRKKAADLVSEAAASKSS
jgi:hypothetical protein